MKVIEGSVTAAKGFRAAGNAVGVKGVITEKKDLAIIVSDVPAVAAGAFTTNVVKATSVTRNMKIMEGKGKINAVVANSGNANACTGEEGIKSNKHAIPAFAHVKDFSGFENTGGHYA